MMPRSAIASGLPIRPRRACARIAARIFGAVAILGAVASAAPAQVVLDQAASILIYPEIIVGGIRDTTVQIVNTGNSAEHARCFYVNYAGTCSSTGTPCVTANDCSDCVQGSVATEFNINLSRQQPTVWVASQGRASGTSLVPPMTAPFYGELVCVEVNAAGTPTSGNRLIGEATVVDTSSGDVAKYHAAGLQGLDTNDGDNALCLGGGVSAECPAGAEYAACPQSWLLDFVTDGTEDSIIGTGSAVHTNLTAVPCTLDLSSQIPGQAIAQFLVTNQFAQRSSTSAFSNRLFDTPLASIDTQVPDRSIFSRTILGTDYAHTVMSSAQGSGFVAIGQEFHASGSSTSEALSPVPIGTHTAGDVITLP